MGCLLDSAPSPFFFQSLLSVSGLGNGEKGKKITDSLKLGTDLYVRLGFFFPLTTSRLPESNPERRGEEFGRRCQSFLFCVFCQWDQTGPAATSPSFPLKLQ